MSLLQNGISVRIIEKEPKSRVGQRGSGLQVSNSAYATSGKTWLNLQSQPRSLELFKFLGVLEDIQAKGMPVPTMRRYEAGTQKPLKTWDVMATVEPSADRPYVSEHFPSVLFNFNFNFILFEF